MTINIAKSYEPSIILCKIFGIWPAISPKFFYLYKHILVPALILDVLSLFAYISQLTNVYDIVEENHTAFNFFNCVVKQCLFYRVHGQMAECLKYFKMRTFQPRNAAQAEILKRSIRKSLAMFYVLFTTIGSAASSLCIMPIFQGSYRMPANAWYPFEYADTKLFYVLYMYQSISIFYFAFCSIAIDTCFTSQLIQLGAQCDCLADQLRNLGRRNETKREIRAELKSCIARHLLILEWSKKVMATFSSIIALQIITSAAVLCQTLFAMSLTSDVKRLVNLAAYQWSIFVQILLYCWWGNELTLKSAMIAYRAYQGHWYNYPAAFQKDLLFFMRRTQKPIIPMVAKLFPISNPTFMSLVKTSWSYFMALRSVQNQN